MATAAIGTPLGTLVAVALFAAGAWLASRIWGIVAAPSRGPVL